MNNIILAALALFIAVPAYAATDYYLKIDDIDGESSARTQTSVTSRGTTTEASADYYLKIDGVEGESEEKKGGNVEFEWKVEEGESAAPKPGIEPDEIDFMGGSDDSAFGVEREMKESGEKGGTEDINIGVGELQETASGTHVGGGGGGAGKVNMNTESMRGGISIAAGDINGLTEEEKQEFLAQVRAHAEVQSEQDLQNFARGVMLENDALDQVSFNFEKIQVRHRAEGKLFGLIPLTYVQEVEVDTEGDDIGRVKVKTPWFAFLMSKAASAADLEQAAQAAADDKHKGWIDVESLNFNAQAQVIQTISNVLKAKFGASAAADDAASSLGSSMGF